jgi:hypothetical protein
VVELSTIIDAEGKSWTIDDEEHGKMVMVVALLRWCSIGKNDMRDG